MIGQAEDAVAVDGGDEAVGRGWGRLDGREAAGGEGGGGQGAEAPTVEREHETTIQEGLVRKGRLGREGYEWNDRRFSATNSL